MLIHFLIHISKESSRFPQCHTSKKETVSNLIEISVQEAAGQVRGSFHKLEEAHKVVAVDCSECLDSKLHLRGIAHLVT